MTIGMNAGNVVNAGGDIGESAQNVVSQPADTSLEAMYQFLREFLTANNIPIAHSVENFNALINTFFGREQDGVWATDLMQQHFDVYRLDDGTIDPQAAADINNYLASIGYEDATFDASFSTDSGVMEDPIDDPTAPDAPTANPQGIMAGGELVKIVREDGTEIYAVSYGVGGFNHIYTFDSLEQVEQTLGPNWASNGLTVRTMEDIRNDDTSWLLGEAAGFIGQTGNYQTFWDDLMYEAALEAGVRNPGLLGEYMSQPEVQMIIAMGAEGGWSQARIQAELRNTDYYQNTLYPGITTFLEAGYSNPEQAYWNYMGNVSESLSALGYQKDEFGTYRTQVGQMLEGGITAAEFNEFAPTFIRAEGSQAFADSLNAWTERDLGISLDFDNWFDVLAGSTTPEMQQIVEKATLQFVADTTTTILSAEQISRLAELTDFSEQQMSIAFNNAEQRLLSVGDAYLSRYDLSQEQLVNAAFGVDSGGTSAAEITQRAQKAAQELGIMDDNKASFFVGFDRFARPTRQGLQATAPESG